MGKGAEKERGNKRPPLKRKHWILIAVLVLLLVLIGGTVLAASAVLSDERVYKGVTVGGMDAVGLTEGELGALLEEEVQKLTEEGTLTVSYGEKEETLAFSELDLAVDTAALAHEAYLLGHEGGTFPRLKEILRLRFYGEALPLKPTINEEEVLLATDRLLEGEESLLTETTYLVEDDELIVKNGSPGLGYDADAFMEEISEMLMGLTPENKEIRVALEVSEMNPEPLDADALHDEVYCEPEDMREEEQPDGTKKIIPHVVGVDFDLLEAKEMIAKNDVALHPDLAGESYTIDLTLTMPEKVYRPPVNSYVAGRYTTYFDAGLYGRTTNIRLASQKIDGTVLAPGETFSFNKIVGRRTSAAGYQDAKIFVGGRVIDELGGGICQVTSTLYNAIMRADLEVVERHNHSLAVSYVPLGQDAAVAYGSLDFKFRNNTDRTIKVSAKVSGSSLTCEITGFEWEEGKEISFENHTLSTTPFTVETEYSDKLPEGQEVVLQGGNNGYVVESYKVTKVNGTVVKRERLGKSVYNPQNKVIQIGGADPNKAPEETAPPEETAQSEETAPPAEPPTVENEATTPDTSSSEETVTPGTPSENPPAETTESPVVPIPEPGQSE